MTAKNNSSNDASETMNCIVCGKKISKCFTYLDNFGQWCNISDCCDNQSCIDEYSDRFGDSEPYEDPEDAWQRQQDDMWEADVLWKED